MASQSLVNLQTYSVLAARVLHFGSPKYLQLDDWLMIVTLCFYTTEVVTLNIVTTSETNLLPPGYLETHTLSPAEISKRIYGSKITLVVEQCQVVVIWLVKACLLTMYYRITYAAFPLQNKLVILLAVYVGLTFVVLETLALFVWCRPFHEYWAVPAPNTQCNAATHHLEINAAFNLSSDMAMLAIAIPMFLRSQLPLQRKLALCCVFGLGIFTITSASLNKYYSFTNPFGHNWVFWYLRECSTAVLVANLPFLWGLARRGLGLHEDDSFPTHLDYQKGKVFFASLRQKVNPNSSSYGSSSTDTEDAAARKEQDSAGNRTSQRIRSGDFSGTRPGQDMYELQLGPMSPLKLEGLQRPSSIASTLASTQASSRRTQSTLPSSRLEAEIMMDDEDEVGPGSPRISYYRRNPEEMLPNVVVSSPREKVVVP
ncbi:MAG: hypothetical protein Q9159_002394 [Coniocarpon cinnabarinum]